MDISEKQDKKEVIEKVPDRLKEFLDTLYSIRNGLQSVLEKWEKSKSSSVYITEEEHDAIEDAYLIIDKHILKVVSGKEPASYLLDIYRMVMHHE